MHYTSELSTQQLFDQYVLPTYARFPLQLAKGKGSRLWDENGKCYLDFGAGIAVCSLGHSHPKLAQAIFEQANILVHTSNLYYTRSQGLLAKRLTEIVGLPGKTFFCNSGAEANEGLFKLARKFGNDWSTHHFKPIGERFEIITFQHSFHGRTLSAIAATGQEKVQKGFSPLVTGFPKATFNDLESVKKLITDHTTAILVEPIQGEGGVIPATKEFLKGLRELCDQHHLLLMFDEIQCGFGRTGHWCGWKSCVDEVGVEPDAISWAKGIASGFPLGAFWVKHKPLFEDQSGKTLYLDEILGPGNHGSTFGGLPLACVAALTTLDIIESEQLIENAALQGRELILQLTKELIYSKSSVIEVRGRGLMIGLQLDPNLTIDTIMGQAPSVQFVNRCQERGLLVIPSGTHCIRLLPALNIAKEDCEDAIQILSEVVRG